MITFRKSLIHLAVLITFFPTFLDGQKSPSAKFIMKATLEISPETEISYQVFMNLCGKFKKQLEKFQSSASGVTFQCELHANEESGKPPLILIRAFYRFLEYQIGTAPAILVVDIDSEADRLALTAMKATSSFRRIVRQTALSAGYARFPLHVNF